MKTKTKMKISHVISSIDKNAGGPSVYIKFLLEALESDTIQNLMAFDSLNNIAIEADVKLFLAKRSRVNIFFSKSMIFNLKISDADLFHGNGLWDYPVHAMAKIALKRKVPYLISTHGMLEPWSLLQKKSKKQLALKLYQYNDLKTAACLHATSAIEANNIREAGFKNPIAIIPNGIPLEDFPLKKSNNTQSKKILFLSRIHPKKGVELLIEAWSKLPVALTENWCVDIVGNGEAQYISQLNKLINEKGIQDNFFIMEPLYGEEKIKAYQEANLFVLPSYCENFGIVVAEALACGTAVITTTGTPWQDLEIHRCGWWIEIGVEPLRIALEEALNTSQGTLQTMGERGRELIEKKYEMKTVARQMLELYEWILKENVKPNFVKYNNENE